MVKGPAALQVSFRLWCPATPVCRSLCEVLQPDIRPVFQGNYDVKLLKKDEGSIEEVQGPGTRNLSPKHDFRATNRKLNVGNPNSGGEGRQGDVEGAW